MPNSGDIVQVGEVYFQIRGELENGLEIGGRIELETQQDTDNIDAARVDIAGSFGAFQLGQEDSARHNWAFDTAGSNEGILINSGWETAFALSTQNSVGLLRPSHSTALDFSDKAPKVTYFTPRMGGFQFALSWTPDTQTTLGTFIIGNGTAGSQGSLKFGVSDQNTTYTNAIDIGAHYEGEMGGVGIVAQAGFGTVNAPDKIDDGFTTIAGAIAGIDDDDPTIYQAGLALTMGGLRVAGGWAREDHGLQICGGGCTMATQVQRTDGWSATAGVGYSTGPWAFATSYLHGEDEGVISNPGQDENDMFQVSSSYSLSPGLSVNAQYLYISREADIDGGNQDNTTHGVFLGVKAGF